MVANNEKLRHRELAGFLKTRRAKILPSQVGLAAAARRRTPGLRREEVAQLAGVSLTWYTWLEQGRPIQVSAQVVESLCRVLLLDRQERSHLYLLANQPLPADIPAYPSVVSPILQHVLDSFEICPAFIADQRWNVIAWNEAARFIFGDFTEMNARQRNIVWGMFTDPYYRQLYAHWDAHAKSLMGRFRSTCGKYIEDAWLNQFIEDLKAESPEFNLWWPLHEVHYDSSIFKQFNHPKAGALEFESSSFDVPDHSGLKLFVHVPVPASDTAAKMKRWLGEG
ncbi:transcriptional regulator [Ornatilinea apprima]|uniref:Transcriptional regulator n=1 Tax=Ornatilinea apprima TaxID=1134406 RepID=A0A0P6XL02_9CHLR|nr:helix-turn-helix transcriptional regulator [Ornatilinea apprima]KPL76852.1 transcriptional regulator [Ornatilinea apprima]